MRPAIMAHPATGLCPRYGNCQWRSAFLKNPAMPRQSNPAFSQPFGGFARQNCNMRSLLAVLLCCIPAATVVAAADMPAFETAVVKPTAPDSRGGTGVRNYPGGRMTADNMTLKELVAFAWRVQRFQITGEPAWASSLHYDITAKAPGNPGPDRLREMLQPLIEERFKVQLHRETRDMPVFALTVDPDRKLAPGLSETKESACASPPCESLAAGSLSAGRSSINGQGVKMPALAALLSRILDTTVVDKTGRDGSFDIHLRWLPDPKQEFGGRAPQPPPGAKVPPATGPSIFAAVEEQLGLKLEAQQGPVEMLVIEHAERPPGN